MLSFLLLPAVRSRLVLGSFLTVWNVVIGERLVPGTLPLPCLFQMVVMCKNLFFFDVFRLRKNLSIADTTHSWETGQVCSMII